MKKILMALSAILIPGILFSAIKVGGGGSGNATSIQSVTVDSAASSPSANQILKYDGTNWALGSDADSGAASSSWLGGSGIIYTSTNNVGIGTTSPGGKLHVSSAAATNNNLLLLSTGTVNLFAVNGTSAVLQIPLHVSGATVTITGDAFSVGTSTFVVKAGQVGIGNTAPSVALDVTGAAEVSGTFSVGSAGSNLYADGTRVGIGTTNPALSLDISYAIETGTTGVSVQNTAAAGYSGIKFLNDSGAKVFEAIYANDSAATHPAETYLTIPAGRIGVGTSSPSYAFHLTTAAASTANLFMVSTGAVNVFQVAGGSVVLRVPLYFPDGTSQVSAAAAGTGDIEGVTAGTNLTGGGTSGTVTVNLASNISLTSGTFSGDVTVAGLVKGSGGTGRITLSDTANSSMTFVSSGGTHTITTQGFVTSAATAEIGNTSNLTALQLGASSATFNQNLASTGTVKGTKFIDSSSNIVAKATGTWIFNISTSSLALNTTWQVGVAPDDSAITLTRVRAASFSVAASTINFSLYERATPNGSNTAIFSNTVSSGTWTETTTTSFGDSSIAAGSGVYISPPSGGATFQTGTTSGLKLLIDYLYVQ